MKNKNSKLLALTAMAAMFSQQLPHGSSAMPATPNRKPAHGKPKQGRIDDFFQQLSVHNKPRAEHRKNIGYWFYSDLDDGLMVFHINRKNASKVLNRLLKSNGLNLEDVVS